MIFTSCRNYTGFAELQDSIHRHLASAQRERWARNAKAYSESFLEEKRRACEKVVTLVAGAAAANGLNPVPGVDIAVDVALLQAMFMKLKNAYGLKAENLETVAKFAPAVAPLVNQVIEFFTKEGFFCYSSSLLRKTH